MLLRDLAIEVYWAWGNDFIKMFTHFISLGAVVNHIPKAVLANYRRRRISVSLQRGVANAINTRTNRLTARTRGIQGRIPDCLWRGGGLLGMWHNGCLGVRHYGCLGGGWCSRSDHESCRQVDRRRTAWCGPDHIFLGLVSNQITHVLTCFAV